MWHCGGTALHLAARTGHDKIVQQLLLIKPELANAKNIRSYTALHEAVTKGHNKVVEQLLPLAHSSHLKTAMLEAEQWSREYRGSSICPESLTGGFPERLGSRDSSAPRCQERP